MVSTISWIDFDSAARDRSLRILALFQEKESRDELGIGGIRDSIGDQLFPGTSTIQTRLRYMLFVPWMYQCLENRQVSVEQFGRRADGAERDLIDVMRNADKREDGILGGRAGRSLKRLPSSVYWAGLREWGIRRIDLSQDQYHRQIGQIYKERNKHSQDKSERSSQGDDFDAGPSRCLYTWHPRLPMAPDDFPKKASFDLTRDEAQFILDRIKQSHPESLLAHLALHCKPADCSFPWEHPDRAGFSDANLSFLNHARLFSESMHGAALIYNLELWKKRNNEEKVEVLRNDISNYVSDLNIQEFREWPLHMFWELVRGHGYTITERTTRFVESWIGILISQSRRLADHVPAARLVRMRERELKGSRSRFDNSRALDQWTGSSGLGRLSYRWGRVMVLLKDLDDGLYREDA